MASTVRASSASHGREIYRLIVPTTTEQQPLSSAVGWIGRRVEVRENEGKIENGEGGGKAVVHPTGLTLTEYCGLLSYANLRLDC